MIVVPGEVVIKDPDETIPYNLEPEPAPPLPAGMPWRRDGILVRNDGDRAVQVGSHFHFYEANPGFRHRDPGAPPPTGDVGHLPTGLVILDPAGNEVSEEEKERLTVGYRLDIKPGTALRFEPGEAHDVRLVALAGKGTAMGLSTRGILFRWRWYPTPAGRNFSVD